MIKKAIGAAIFSLAIIFVFASAPVYATDVYINGQKMDFTNRPVNVNGRILVPMGELFNALNADVEWDGASQCVKGSSTSGQVMLYINNTTAYKNGQPITLDVPPLIIDGRTMVPLGFIGLSLGCQVSYDGDNDRVILTYGENSSGKLAVPKVLFDGEELTMEHTPVGFVNGTLMLGLSMTGNSQDYVFRNSCNILTCFYPGSRKVNVYKAHVNSAGLTDQMDLLESFEMDSDPIFYWNQTHDRIDYVMVPLQLYAKAAHCMVEYDSVKNVINVEQGITSNSTCSGITSDQQPIYNNNWAFSKSEDIYAYYKSSSPIRADRLIGVFTYRVGNRSQEIYREEIQAKGKTCFWFELPGEKLELPQYLGEGNGEWFHHVYTIDGLEVSSTFFDVVPAGKQWFMYLWGIKMNSGQYWLDYDISNYFNPDSGEYVIPSGTLQGIDCKAITLTTAQITRAKFEMRCINRDTGSTMYNMQSEPFGDFDAPLSPIPGRYEYALYADGVYQNSVFLTVADV
ncbi:MAG: copper amine oxidase N-terminal domain-containing protein [Syntrophomonadaceae bacterium]